MASGGPKNTGAGGPGKADLEFLATVSSARQADRQATEAEMKAKRLRKEATAQSQLLEERVAIRVAASEQREQERVAKRKQEIEAMNAVQLLQALQEVELRSANSSRITMIWHWCTGAVSSLQLPGTKGAGPAGASEAAGGSKEEQAVSLDSDAARWAASAKAKLQKALNIFAPDIKAHLLEAACAPNDAAKAVLELWESGTSGTLDTLLKMVFVALSESHWTFGRQLAPKERPLLRALDTQAHQGYAISYMRLVDKFNIPPGRGSDRLDAAFRRFAEHVVPYLDVLWDNYLRNRVVLLQKLAEKETGSPYGLDRDGNPHPNMTAHVFWEDEHGCEACQLGSLSQHRHTSCLLDTEDEY